MKKQSFPFLIILTAVFAAFTFGFFFGRNQKTDTVQVSVPEAMYSIPSVEMKAPDKTQETSLPVSFPVNINTAAKEELMTLPGIGSVLADRILAYREESGGFTSVEGLMFVDGIGEKRMEELLEFITIGGQP